MAISVTAGTAKVLQNCTVTIAGAAATTAYVLTIKHPDGSVETHPVTTDGSGGATVTYVPQTRGTATYNLTTVAAVAATASGVHSS